MRMGGGSGAAPGARGAAAGARRQGRPAQEVLRPPAEGLQVLRGEDRVHRLEGHQDAPGLHPRARQDPAAPHLGHLRPASAQTPDGHQARPLDRAAAVRNGLAGGDGLSGTPRGARGSPGDPVEIPGGPGGRSRRLLGRSSCAVGGVLGVVRPPAASASFGAAARPPCPWCASRTGGGWSTGSVACALAVAIVLGLGWAIGGAGRRPDARRSRGGRHVAADGRPWASCARAPTRRAATSACASPGARSSRRPSPPRPERPGPVGRRPRSRRPSTGDSRRPSAVLRALGRRRRRPSPACGRPSRPPGTSPAGTSGESSGPSGCSAAPWPSTRGRRGPARRHGRGRPVRRPRGCRPPAAALFVAAGAAFGLLSGEARRVAGNLLLPLLALYFVAGLSIICHFFRRWFRARILRVGSVRPGRLLPDQRRRGAPGALRLVRGFPPAGRGSNRRSHESHPGRRRSRARAPRGHRDREARLRPQLPLSAGRRPTRRPTPTSAASPRRRRSTTRRCSRRRRVAEAAARRSRA